MPKMNAFVFLLLAAVLFILATVAVAKVTKVPGDIDVHRMIESLAAVENWDHISVGAKGERGRLQFMPATWKSFSKKPHAWAGRLDDPRCIRETERVEYAYVITIMGEADRMFDVVTPYNIGLLHCAGYKACRDGRVTQAKVEFAERVDAIYHSMQ